LEARRGVATLSPVARAPERGGGRETSRASYARRNTPHYNIKNNVLISNLLIGTEFPSCDRITLPVYISNTSNIWQPAAVIIHRCGHLTHWRIWCFHRGGYEEFCLPICNVLLSVESQQHSQGIWHIHIQGLRISKLSSGPSYLNVTSIHLLFHFALFKTTATQFQNLALVLRASLCMFLACLFANTGSVLYVLHAVKAEQLLSPRGSWRHIRNALHLASPPPFQVLHWSAMIHP
jgi:hypothetical protein